MILAEEPCHPVDGIVTIGGGVDLGAVAGREDRHFADGVPRRKARQRGFEPLAGEVHPFAQLDRRGSVTQPDREQPKAQKLWLLVRKYPIGMKLSSTIAKPAVDNSAARRPFQPIARRA